MTTDEQKELFPSIETHLRDAETKAIATYAALGAEAGAQVSGFSEDVWRSVRVEIKHAVTAQQSDGTQISYLEVWKNYRTPQECGLESHTGVAVVSEGAAGHRLLSAESEIVCEKFASRVPLAILERGNSRCWVVHDSLYEGHAYRLTRAGQWVTEREDCRME